MHLGPTEIVDNFAEAFRLRYTRLIVTANDDYWLDAAVEEAGGYTFLGHRLRLRSRLGAPSHRRRNARRPRGCVAVTVGFSSEQVGKAAMNRTGQCLMTCPSTAVFDGLPQSGDECP